MSNARDQKENAQLADLFRQINALYPITFQHDIADATMKDFKSKLSILESAAIRFQRALSRGEPNPSVQYAECLTALRAIKAIPAVREAKVKLDIQQTKELFDNETRKKHPEFETRMRQHAKDPALHASSMRIPAINDALKEMKTNLNAELKKYIDEHRKGKEEFTDALGRKTERNKNSERMYHYIKEASKEPFTLHSALTLKGWLDEQLTEPTGTKNKKDSPNVYELMVRLQQKMDMEYLFKSTFTRDLFSRLIHKRNELAKEFRRELEGNIIFKQICAIKDAREQYEKPLWREHYSLPEVKAKIRAYDEELSQKINELDPHQRELYCFMVRRDQYGRYSKDPNRESLFLEYTLLTNWDNARKHDQKHDRDNRSAASAATAGFLSHPPESPPSGDSGTVSAPSRRPSSGGKGQ